MIPLICIEGATASGKSSLAIKLAEILKTEIISADSRQIYRYMNIGTAKVSAEIRRQIPHHLIDIINPDQSYNAGSFAKDAKDIISSLHQKGKLPIICGGTGLYIRSLLDGLFTLPELPEEIRIELKQRLHSEGLPSLYQQLVSLDPLLAGKLSSNDPQRIMRGLEVALGTGIPLSTHWQNQAKTQPYKVFRILIDPPRSDLYQHINSRLQEMLQEGLLNEIRQLLDSGYTSDSPGLNSLGYKEFMPYFNNAITLMEACDNAAQHHRNYAKRQCTWYRKCTFDLTLANNQINLSVLVDKIKYILN